MHLNLANLATGSKIVKLARILSVVYQPFHLMTFTYSIHVLTCG